MRTGKYFPILLCLFVAGAVAACAAEPEQAGLSRRQDFYVDLTPLEPEVFEGDVDRLIDGFCAYLDAFHGTPSLFLVRKP